MLLMEEAERIAREEHGSVKIAVISGYHSNSNVISFTLLFQVWEQEIIIAKLVMN